MDQTQPTGANSLKDAIVTLPTWGIALIALLCTGSLALASWLAMTATNDGIKATSVQLLVFMVPLTSAVIASMAIRRTSTKQIDRLITGFLEQTIFQRFETWCSQPSKAIFTDHGYPFSSVKLREPTQGLSYAHFIFKWRDFENESAIVGIKTNVFNFEIFSRLELHLPHTHSATPLRENLVIDRTRLKETENHQILSSFIGLIQGSVNEGYDVKIEFSPVAEKHDHPVIAMRISLRQKVRENFLTSPFLKRYFAEDAAIAIGVLFSEFRTSGFMKTHALDGSTHETA